MRTKDFAADSAEGAPVADMTENTLVDNGGGDAASSPKDETASPNLEVTATGNHKSENVPEQQSAGDSPSMLKEHDVSAASVGCHGAEVSQSEPLVRPLPKEGGSEKTAEVALATSDEMSDASPTMRNSVEPLAVDASSVEPLAVDASSVEPLAVDASSVEPLAVDASSVEPLAIDASSVEPLAVDASSVEPLAVDASSVEPLAVDASLVEPLAVDPSSVEPLAVDASSVEPLAVDASSVEPLAVDASSVEPLAVDASSVEPLAVDASNNPELGLTENNDDAEGTSGTSVGNDRESVVHEATIGAESDGGPGPDESNGTGDDGDVLASRRDVSESTTNDSIGNMAVSTVESGIVSSDAGLAEQVPAQDIVDHNAAVTDASSVHPPHDDELVEIPLVQRPFTEPARVEVVVGAPAPSESLEPNELEEIEREAARAMAMAERVSLGLSSISAMQQSASVDNGSERDALDSEGGSGGNVTSATDGVVPPWSPGMTASASSGGSGGTPFAPDSVSELSPVDDPKVCVSPTPIHPNVAQGFSHTQPAMAAVTSESRVPLHGSKGLRSPLEANAGMSISLGAEIDSVDDDDEDDRVVSIGGRSASASSESGSGFSSEDSDIELVEPFNDARTVLVDRPDYLSAWQIDERVSKCRRCKIEFDEVASMVSSGKHHCRCCGHIFCGKCSSKKRTLPHGVPIPSAGSAGQTIGRVAGKVASGLTSTVGYYMSSTPVKGSSAPEDQHRVCDSCDSWLSARTSLNDREQACRIAFLYLDLSDWVLLARVCKRWRILIRECISALMALQHLLPNSPIKPLDRGLLWRNRRFLSGHTAWLLPFAWSLDDSTNKDEAIQVLRGSRRCPAMCSRLCVGVQCSDKLQIEHAVQLLWLPYREIRDFALSALREMGAAELDDEFECYLTMLVHQVRLEEHLNWQMGLPLFLKDRALEAAKRGNPRLIYRLLQAVTLETMQDDTRLVTLYSALKTRIMSMLSTSGVDSSVINTCQIQRGEHFVSMLRIVAEKKSGVDGLRKLSHLGLNNGTVFTTCGDTSCPTCPDSSLVLPVNPDLRVTGVGASYASHGASAPTVIPCILSTSPSSTPIPTTICVMYKPDDIRPDESCLSVIRLMTMIVRKDLGLDLALVMYNVVPTSRGGGLVEFVNNASTLFEIRQGKGGIFRYLADHNPSDVPGAQKRFMRSAAAYSVMTYLLGVGDRHEENVMLTHKGDLFHVDYGFILGDQPHYVARQAPTVRIDAEFYDCFESDGTRAFKELCTKIFLCLRRHAPLFLTMMTHIQLIQMGFDPAEATLKEQFQRVANHVQDRFMTDRSDEEAAAELVYRLESSVDHVGQRLADSLHRHAKEKTLERGVQGAGYWLDKGVQGATGGVWAVSSMLGNLGSQATTFLRGGDTQEYSEGAGGHANKSQ